MLDHRLLGLWSERPLFPHDVESAELTFRANGTGWLYWSSWSTSFTVSRYTWALTRPGHLALKFHRTLDGTWSIDDGVTRHEVESEEPDDTNVEIGYRIGPGEGQYGERFTVLSFDHPLHGYLAGSRFGWVDEPKSFSDPSADAPRPGPPSPR